MQAKEIDLKMIIVQAIQEALPKQQKATMTIDEAAEYTGIGRDRLLQLAHCQTNDFPSFKVGYRFLVNRKLLDEWLERIAEEGRIL